MIDEARIHPLNDRSPKAGQACVLYWMQASQRERYNHALEFAIQRANEAGKPLLVAFGLTGDYPAGNARHYRFMLAGLAETQAALAERDIRMVVQIGQPPEVAARLARDAAEVVTDRGYLRHQVAWRADLADRLSVPLTEVESDVVVPVQTASDKAEYAARTIRPKIHRHLDAFLVEMHRRRVDHSSMDLSAESVDLADPDTVLGELGVDASVPPVPDHPGGPAEADRRLQRFLRSGLADYDSARNDPNLDGLSGLSPYLHFGQISPVRIASAVRSAGGEGAEAFLEELVVRRELAINFVWYTDNYDRFDALPDWARKTLAAHADDPRQHLYTPEQLERADTHDPYWNAAQREMVLTGKMHGYMRMYWGKKVLQWSPSPAEAHRRLVWLNDRYELDGRDPNGYANILWCFGLHDRPWQQREVFGTVRYMNDRGLRRKFDADAYVAKVEQLAAERS